METVNKPTNPKWPLQLEYLILTRGWELVEGPTVLRETPANPHWLQESPGSFQGPKLVSLMFTKAMFPTAPEGRFCLSSFNRFGYLNV